MRQALVILLWLILVSFSVLDYKSHAEDHSASSVQDLVFDPTLSDALQEALEEAARVQGADSISASLYLSDQCHWEGTTGVTKQDPNIPVEPDMLYGFGSITKTFVAAIVLQLVEENRLSLEDKIERWLDKYPYIDPNITIHQLLDHTLPIRLSPTPTICSVSPWTAGKGRRRRIEEAIRLILDCSKNRTGV